MRPSATRPHAPPSTAERSTPPLVDADEDTSVPHALALQHGLDDDLPL
jgi:hypothetical protein